MNRFLFCLAGLVSLAAAMPARAETPARPPVIISPALNEPWLMQIRPQYRASVGAQTAAYARPVGINPSSDGSAERVAQQHETPPQFLPTVVLYSGPHKPGTIIVDTEERYLFLVEANGRARRYGVGVGRPGFQWAGEHKVTRKAEWPDWVPPPAMLKRVPSLPKSMEGGPNNPLGARALYLGSTEFRIHGSNEPWTIGQAVSSGCFRMRNEDVTDLYERVKVGARVIVL